MITAEAIIDMMRAESKAIKEDDDHMRYIQAKKRMDATLKGEVYRDFSYEIKRGNINRYTITRYVKCDSDRAIEILTMLIKKMKVRVLYKSNRFNTSRS